jgi:hypothetical protein
MGLLGYFKWGHMSLDVHIENLVATYNDEGRLSLQDSSQPWLL